MAEVDILTLLSTIINVLVGGIVGIAEGIGTGLSALVSAIFLSAGSLSVFGAFILIFGACALAFSMSRWVLNFLTSMGNRNS